MAKNRLNQYNDLNVEQLRDQQRILREKIDNGDRNFSSKVRNVLMAVLCGVTGGIFGSAIAAGTWLNRGAKAGGVKNLFALKDWDHPPKGMTDYLEANEKRVIKGVVVSGATSFLGAAIGGYLLDRKYSRIQAAEQYNHELSHIERLLNEKGETHTTSRGI